MNKPNIIYIICHDIGKHVGAYGAPIRTPNLDAFAEEGILFTNAFCNSPACSPSRGCGMTGQYAHTNGMVGLSHLGWSLDPCVRTIVDELNDHGYETAHVGFQHERNDVNRNRYHVEMLTKREDTYCENAVDTAIAYLKKKQGSNTPFYLNVGTIEVHASRWLGTFGELDRSDIYGTVPEDEVYLPPHMPDAPQTRREFAKFQACVAYFDVQMGRLFSAIKEMGYDKNSVVVFTTDHGISGLRAKGTLYDRGVEIALMAQLPEGARAGTVCDELIPNIDNAPTMLDIAGAPIPEWMEGRTYKPLLVGEAYEPHDAVFIERNYHSDYDPIRAIRTKTHHLIWNFDEDARWHWLPDEIPELKETFDMWMNGMWKPFTKPRPREELYNVVNDPNEWKNVADAPLEAKTKSVLAKRLDTWMRARGDFLITGNVPQPKNQNE